MFHRLLPDKSGRKLMNYANKYMLKNSPAMLLRKGLKKAYFRAFPAIFMAITAMLVSVMLAPINSLALQPAPQTGFVGVDPTPAGTIPWQLLLQAKTVQRPNKKFGPVFTEQI